MNKARVSIQERHPWLQGVLFAFTQEMQHKKKVRDSSMIIVKVMRKHWHNTLFNLHYS